MAQFDAILLALSQGKSVRRDEWQPIARMFVSSEMLMCQRGNTQPWQHALTWVELVASDWQLFQTEPTALQTHRMAATLPAACVSDRALRSSLGDAGVYPNSFLLRFLPNRRNI